MVMTLCKIAETGSYGHLQNAEKRVICNLQRIERSDDLFGICREEEQRLIVNCREMDSLTTLCNFQKKGVMSLCNK